MRLFGKNPVIERLRTNPASIRKIYLQQGYGSAGYIYKKAKQWNIPVFSVPKTKIVKIARNINTQGILADVDEFAYCDLDEVLDISVKKRRSLVFLDRLSDPQNLGAIIRGLACLGGFSVVLPTHDSVQVTEAVLRVASGGENYVPVVRVANLANAIRKTKESGFFIIGAVVSGGERLTEVQLPYPISIVIGSEQKGIRARIQDLLDLKVTIPMHASTLSFNVSHATTIFCYEITRQKEAYSRERRA